MAPRQDSSMRGQTTLAFPRDFAGRLEQLRKLHEARATATDSDTAPASHSTGSGARSATQAVFRGVAGTQADTQGSLVGPIPSSEHLVCVSIPISPDLLSLGDDSGLVLNLPLNADTETDTSIRSSTKGAALGRTATWPSADTAISQIGATRGAGPSRVVLGAAEMYAAFSRQGGATRALDLTGWAMDLSEDGDEVIFENPFGTGASGSMSTGLMGRFDLSLGAPAAGGVASSYLRAVKMPVATAKALFAGAGPGAATGISRDQGVGDEQDKAKAAFDGLMSTSSMAVLTGGGGGLVDAIPGMVSGGLESIQLVFATIRSGRKMPGLQHASENGEEDEDFPGMDGVLFE